MSRLIIRIRQYELPKQRPSRRWALGLYLLAGAGLFISSLLCGVLFRNVDAQYTLTVVDLLFYLPFVALPILLGVRRRPETLEAYRPGGLSLSNAILIALLAVAGLLFMNSLTVLWSILLQKLGLVFPASNVPTPTGKGSLMLSIFTVAVLPAICEEFLFRGAIFSALEPEGTRHAMVISSLLFMGLHGSLNGAPVQFLLGMIICYLTWSCNSIYAGMIYHMVHNATTVILMYIQSGLDVTAEAPDYLAAIGGLTGVFALLLDMLLLGGLMLLLLRPFRIRALLSGAPKMPRKKIPLSRKGRWAVVIIIVLLLTLYALTLLGALL